MWGKTQSTWVGGCLIVGSYVKMGVVSIGVGVAVLMGEGRCDRWGE